MTDSSTDADSSSDAPPAEVGEIDRRRLIRWIAVLAFSVPVVVELFTFSGLIENELLANGDEAETASASPTQDPDAVGIDDELLPETAATETVTTSEVRQDDAGDRTYVLRVDVENGTESTVELRLRTLRLRDGTTVDGISSTGQVEPGGSQVVTAAWSLPTESMPEAVEAVAIRDGETVVSTFVALERPAIVG